jgi:hypothetical protein
VGWLRDMEIVFKAKYQLHSRYEHTIYTTIFQLAIQVESSASFFFFAALSFGGSPSSSAVELRFDAFFADDVSAGIMPFFLSIAA